MKPNTYLVKQTTLNLLRKLLAQQEATQRHLENKVVENLESIRDTQERIEKLEAELEAHELTQL